jgi:hypothetical protein
MHAWYAEHVGHYPLWIVPYRMPKRYPWIAESHLPSVKGQLFIDFAIYGMPNDDPRVCYSRRLEDKTYALGGIKTLIGQNHYDEATFFAVYDRTRYDRIKRRTDPRNLLRTVYEKRVASQLARERAVSRGECRVLDGPPRPQIGPPLGTQRPPEQVSPDPQQRLQVQKVSPARQSGVQVPPLQTSPQPQAGSHPMGTQEPSRQMSPESHVPRVQRPPHPSGAPQTASRGQMGSHSQRPPSHVSPVGQ